MQIEFHPDAFDTLKRVVETLVGFTVALEIPDNTGYPTGGVIARIDDDGDIVLYDEFDERGAPIKNTSIAVPVSVIATLTVL